MWCETDAKGAAVRRNKVEEERVLRMGREGAFAVAAVEIFVLYNDDYIQIWI